MLGRWIVILMVALLGVTPSAATYARKLAITVQQQTGRESSPNNSNQNEEERSEHGSVIPSRRDGIESSPLKQCYCDASAATLHRTTAAARLAHDAVLGEHSRRNGFGAPLTC